MSYFEGCGTLPPPFNIFPPPKLLFKMCGINKNDERRTSLRQKAREHKCENNNSNLQLKFPTFNKILFILYVQI